MEIREDCWLSTIFGHEVFKVDASVNGHTPQFLREAVLSHVPQHPSAMYYAKVETAEVDKVRELQQAGFYVVDVNVLFGRNPSTPLQNSPRSSSSTLVIDRIQPAHHSSVLEIASSCFQFSRFHLDPFIPKEVAHRIKQEWVRNYLRKVRGDELYVALQDQKVVGFLAALSTEREKRRIRIIDLIGVHKVFQNQGVGRALVEFFVQDDKAKSDWLEVGTQVANLPSMRLYERCGFSMTKSLYVMHLHTGKSWA